MKPNTVPTMSDLCVVFLGGLATILMAIGCDRRSDCADGHCAPRPHTVTVSPAVEVVPISGPVVTSPEQIPDEQILGELERADPAANARNRAVVFGLNYPGTGMQLAGCVNDAKRFACELVRRGHLKPAEIYLCLNEVNTAENMRAKLRWLAADARAGDLRVAFYSGHGAQMASVSNTERDRLDEVWVPTDFAWTADTAVTDKFIFETFKATPAGVRLALLSDSCHSGDMIRPSINPDRKPKTITPPAEMAAKIHKAKREAIGGVLDIQYGSGCRDSELSADTRLDGIACGAFTHHFLIAWRANPELSFRALIQSCGSRMRNSGFGDQHPQAEGLGVDRKFLE